MCWACEQDRFWAEYAKYMAAKAATANEASGLAGEGHGAALHTTDDGLARGVEAASDPVTGDD